jgi:Zn-dependent peptidase ImmA (M78 family)
MKSFTIESQRWRIQTASQAAIAEVYRLGHGREPRGTLSGICDYLNRIIMIDQSLSSDQRISTLRHELIHAFMPELEERKVCQLERLIQRAGEMV